jgi:dTDP-glucose pyrophosphorylase
MDLEQLVILAAGRGTRLGKVGKKRQKCSLLFEYNFPIIKDLFKEAIIVTGHRSTDIKRIVKRVSKKYLSEINIDYVKQEEPKGQAHAVYLVKDKIRQRMDFCVVNGDICLEKKYLEEILAKDIETPLIMISEVKDTWNYGIVSFDKQSRINGIVEKPEKGKEPSSWAISGVYFFSKQIFDYIEKTEPNKNKGSEIFLADTLRLMIGEGMGLNYFEIEKPKHLTTAEDLKKLSKFLRKKGI